METRDTYDLIQELIDKNGGTPNWPEIGNEIGKSGEAARSFYRYHSKRKATDDEEKIHEDYREATKIVFGEVKKPENVHWKDLIELANENTAMQERLSSDNKVVNVTIKTDRPISIMHTSDWHLGDTATDHKTWTKDIEFLLETPNLYAIDYGDDRQNMRSFRTLSAVLNQALSPQQQAYLIRGIIEELTQNNKLLAKIGGNHDVEFDERIFGQALQSLLLEKMKAPMFSNRGLLILTVGETQYTILMFHKSRFRSFMRTTHGNYREHQLSFPADIVAGGHDHVPGFEVVKRYELAKEAGFDFGGTVHFIKAGTYQTNSNYGWKYFHDGGIMNPTTVLYPDRKKMVTFDNPRDAVIFMKGI